MFRLIECTPRPTTYIVRPLRGMSKVAKPHLLMSWCLPGAATLVLMLPLAAHSLEHGLKMTGIDRHGRPRPLADATNATCQIRAADRERPLTRYWRAGLY